jgi:G3E family GTPase
LDEVDIDGATIAGNNIEMMELTGGCVCCSLAGEFEAAVDEILETVAPDAVVVETTGVAEADALVMDIEETLPRVRIETVAVLVDADVCARFPELGYTERAQIETADLILLNKTDLVAPDGLEAIRARLRDVNAGALLVETAYADVDPRLLLPGSPETATRRAGSPRETGGRDRHDHARLFAAFHWRPAGALDRRCLEQVVGDWPPEVYRAKGRLIVDNQWHLFNYVAGRWTLDPADAGEPALVFIGPGVDRHRAAIVGALEGCLE